MSADRWEFYLDARGLWCWRRLRTGGKIISDSKRCFPTRNDCIADAMKHGFIAAPARRGHMKGAKLAGGIASAIRDRRRPSAADPQ